MKTYIIDIRTFNLSDCCLQDRLSKSRKERILKLKQPEEKLRTAAAGLLLSLVLKLDEDRDIVRDENGKPHVNPGILSPESSRISLSHGGNYAALIASGSTCGVDVEMIEDFSQAIIKRCFLPDEKEWIMTGDPNERAYSVWTMKESIMKADGRGLGLDPKSFSVFSGDWYIGYMKYDGHMFACASADDFGQMEICRIDVESSLQTGFFA